jgi:hypothetical protein
VTIWHKVERIIDIRGGMNMASSKEYLGFILGQLSGMEDITYRAMMGERNVAGR